LWAVQIMAHSARTFSMPRNRNWRKPRLFDLSEHRFHHLLSQSVGCFEAAIVDLLSHPLGQRSAVPVRVISFNVFEGWSRDVSSEVAEDLQLRCHLEKEVPRSLWAFVESHGRRKKA
jgi:hypothetical protein